jgi:hypothetical protein
MLLFFLSVSVPPRKKEKEDKNITCRSLLEESNIDWLGDLRRPFLSIVSNLSSVSK